MAKTNDKVPAAPKPARTMFRMKMTNIVLYLLLRSPFHKRVSQTLLLLIFRGRRTGRTYCFPVGYIHEGKDDLIILTPKMRSWWKNFRQSAPVTVYVQGQKQQGSAQAFDDDPETIAQGITTFLRQNPKAAPMYRVELNESGEPTPETLQQVVSRWVGVRIHFVGNKGRFTDKG